MRKPQSIPSDKNRRRLVTEPFTFRWTHRCVPHRMYVEPWGASYEPSVPRLPQWLNALGVGYSLGMIVVRLTPIDAGTGLGYEVLSVVWALWALAMAPSLMVGVVAPREALSPVSAAHDITYRRQGQIEYDVLANGRWEPRHQMSRATADAMMTADEDDPLWLRWSAWAYTRLLGWWKWDGWDEWLAQKMPW